MSTPKKTILMTVSLITLGFSGMILSNTCPTKLKHDHNGFWYSDEKPGWKSHKKTLDNVTLSADNFGGVVYSPKHHRIACVYKTSDGKWIALVSNVHHGIVIDKKATDDSGSQPAWQFSKKHQDYTCGHPSVTHIKGCPFQLTD